MADKGFDVRALLQLQAQRDEVSSKIEAFIAERERLEAQPWALCAGGPDGLPEESSQDTEQGRTREAEEVGISFFRGLFHLSSILMAGRVVSC